MFFGSMGRGDLRMKNLPQTRARLRDSSEVCRLEREMGKRITQEEQRARNEKIQRAALEYIRSRTEHRSIDVDGGLSVSQWAQLVTAVCVATSKQDKWRAVRFAIHDARRYLGSLG